MRLLVNKMFAAKDNGPKITAFELMRLSVEQSGRDQGFSIGDIQKRIRVMGALTTEKEECQIEDADYAVLVQCWDGMRWGVVNHDILDVDGILKGAKEVPK